MYKSFQIGLKIKDHPMVNEEKTKVEGDNKHKGRRFQQSNSTRKAIFKAPTTGIEDKVFDFKKYKHVEDLVKNCEEISKYISLNYKHGGPKMATEIKNMDKPTINMPEAS